MAEEILLSTIGLSGEAERVVIPITLRPAGGSDTTILQRIFAESHCAGFGLLGLEPAALAGLVGMQFSARQAEYRTRADAVEYLICQESDVVGSCWLSDGPGQLRVLDIAVLAEHRRRGIARAVLTGLQERAAAAGKPVALSVWHDNAPARELYRALGFVADPEAGDGAAGDLGNGYLEFRYFRAPAPAGVRTGAR